MRNNSEVFNSEFQKTMYKRKAMTGGVNIRRIWTPYDDTVTSIDLRRERVYLKGITDEYYGKLNKEIAVLLSRPKLKRRKFNHKGKFMFDNAGNWVMEDVSVPNGCVAVLSTRRIGVPNLYKSKEGFSYVDYIESKSDKTRVRYIYIIPKVYCYRINRTALVISADKLHKYYSGIKVALQCGEYVYVHVIPFKPSNVDRTYKVLCTKTGTDYTTETNILFTEWVRKGIVFDKKLCDLAEPVGNKVNVAYEFFDSTLDEFDPFSNGGRSLAECKEEEIDFGV